MRKVPLKGSYTGGSRITVALYFYSVNAKDVHLAGEVVSEPFSEPKSLKNRGTSDIILGS